MGSFCEENSGGIDASAGSLVWVRRRNGSWWPGRVLGPTELPADCLMPPRLGTPIKLLGREDGSIDWYNLEKSTRVKAFRCGEFDECIESAKANAARPSKKAPNEGKYVRREDAILHALKLEELRYSDGNHCSEKSNSIITADEDSATQFKSMFDHSKAPGYIARKLGMLEENAAQELTQSAVSFEEPRYPDTTDMQFVPKKRRKTPNDSEDDPTEGMKRMRGLMDLGLGVETKKKSKTLVHTQESHESSRTDTDSLGKSNILDGFCNLGQTVGGEDYCSYLKQKQSRAVQIYEKFKKKSRRRPLTKLMEGTSRVSIPSFSDWNSIAEQSSLQEVNQKKIWACKSSDVKHSIYAPLSDNSSDCSGTSSEEASLDASENACNDFDDGTHSDSELNVNEFPSRMEITDTDCSDGDIDLPKVKSRIKVFPRESGQYLSGKLHPASLERQSNQSNELWPRFQFKEGLDESVSASCLTRVNDCKQKIGKNASRWTSKGRRNTKYLSLMDRVTKDEMLVGLDSKIEHSSFSDSLTTDKLGQLRYGLSLEEAGDVPRIHLEGFTAEICIESAESVNGLSFARDCEALFTGNVPVSVVSSEKYGPHGHTRLSTCSIYPIVEPIRSMPMGSILYDVELNVQTSYRGPRVPLVSLMSKLDGKSIIGHPVAIEILEEGEGDAFSNSNYCRPGASCTEKLHMNASGKISKLQAKLSNHLLSKSPMTKKKPLNGKKQGFSPRKIRSLSSITVAQKDKRERKPVVEKMAGPAVACVPLKLVFSRLNEALSGLARSVV